ncbi:hypothetical protein VNI00_008227 [Paramarasmius palmivorus]|uniref:Uncharacterized protein n=1 Tax=Paramarasmius palmivorus TaxID=297713 RepID=A0AAW0CUU2_9AGAR
MDMNAKDSEFKDHPADLDLLTPSPDVLAMEDGSGGQYGKLARELKNRHVAMISVPQKISLGEMVSYLPISGGHIVLAERFFDPGA